jgi:DNA repair protein RecO (recombination protein O)
VLEAGEPKVIANAEGFRTTGHFLREHLAPALGHKPLPEARARFVDGFVRRIAAG